MLPRLYKLAILGLLTGCVSTLPAMSERLMPDDTAVVGRAVTVLMGPTTRTSLPELRFFELSRRGSGSDAEDRVQVRLESHDAWFVLPLPPGEYEITRILLNEGAFQAMAGLSPAFTVAKGHVTYVGTWRIGVESPQYDRTLILSAVSEPEAEVRVALRRYPILADRPFTTVLPEPVTTETRLFEVPPYPRFWWFRRHHTS